MANKTILVLSDEEYQTLMFMLGVASAKLAEDKAKLGAGFKSSSELVNNLYKFNLLSNIVYQSPGVDITEEKTDET